MKKSVKIILLLSLSTIQLFSQTVKSVSPINFVVSGALELGGDEVAKIYFTNGEDQSVKAGQGGSIAVGGELQFPKEKRLLLRSTIGIKYVTTQADNAHIRLTRFPIHLTANWQISDKVRIGAGLVSHQNIRFKADGVGDNVRFKAANGPFFEIAYRNFGLSYTLMSYKDQTNIVYSANAIGLTCSGIIRGSSIKKKV